MVSIRSLTATLVLSALAANAQVPPNIPASCATTSCQSLLNKFIDSKTGSVTSCATDLTCLCSNDVASAVKSCYQCAVNGKATDQQTADSAIASYLSDCKQSGHPVSSASSLKMSGFAAAAALSGMILL